MKYQSKILKRADKAERKLAKAEAKLLKTEAKLEARKAKLVAAKKIYESALAEANQQGVLEGDSRLSETTPHAHA